MTPQDKASLSLTKQALEMAIAAFYAFMNEKITDEDFKFMQWKACQACKKALEQPSWQGLTNDRIREIGDNSLDNNNGLFNWIDFARAIEQALKEKNHAR